MQTHGVRCSRWERGEDTVAVRARLDRLHRTQRSIDDAAAGADRIDRECRARRESVAWIQRAPLRIQTLPPAQIERTDTESILAGAAQVGDIKGTAGFYRHGVAKRVVLHAKKGPRFDLAIRRTAKITIRFAFAVCTCVEDALD